MVKEADVVIYMACSFEFLYVPSLGTHTEHSKIENSEFKLQVPYASTLLSSNNR